MTKWRIDKKNKVPLYLQLKDLIKYYIATGTIQESQQLPGVSALGEELKINFETVRKAYKELEKEGLITMKRGRGTYVTLQGMVVSQKGLQIREEKDPKEILKDAVKMLIKSGMKPAKIKKIITKTLEEIEQDATQQTIIFTECNLYQTQEFAKILSDYLVLEVKPVLVKDLKTETDNIFKSNGRLQAVITTGFHINDVHNIFRDIPVDIYVLIISMSWKTRKSLHSFKPPSSFGFICRDRESISFWENLIRDELGNDVILTSCIIENKQETENIMETADALIVSPPVYPELKKMTPAGMPVFNVFDQVDTMSLRLIKDKIYESL